MYCINSNTSLSQFQYYSENEYKCESSVIKASHCFDQIFFKIFKAGDGDYIRSSALSKIVVGSLINLRNPEVIDWEGISSAIKDYLNKNL